MSNWILPFSFPIFFVAAIKNNTPLHQYDAVNILLTGNKWTGSSPADNRITPNMTSHFAGGGKPITQGLVTSFLELPREECIQRINCVHLNHPEEAVHCLKELIRSGHLNFSPNDLQHFTSFPADQNQSEFLADMLFAAVRCPRHQVSKLTEGQKSDILSMRATSPFITDFAEQTAIPASELGTESLVQQPAPSAMESQKPSLESTEQFHLNFQFFYNAVIYDNTPFDDVTAVSLLFMPIRGKSMGGTEMLNADDVEQYINGREPVARSLFSSIMQSKHQETVYKIQTLRLEAIYACVRTIRNYLLSGNLILKNQDRNHLLSIKDDSEHNLVFLDAAFRCAISCRNVNHITLTDTAVKMVRSQRKKEDEAIASSTVTSKISADPLPVPPEFYRYRFDIHLTATRYHELNMPLAERFLRHYLTYYGATADSPLAEGDIERIVQLCCCDRSACVFEIYALDYRELLGTFATRVKPHSCAHLTLMAEIYSPGILYYFQDVLRAIYSHSAGKDTPMFLSIQFNRDLPMESVRIRLVYTLFHNSSERIDIQPAHWSDREFFSRKELKEILPPILTEDLPDDFYSTPYSDEDAPDNRTVKKKLINLIQKRG